MSRDIRESDWKLFRQLREVALDRFCQQILSEVGRIVSDTGKSHHERYGPGASPTASALGLDDVPGAAAHGWQRRS